MQFNLRTLLMVVTLSAVVCGTLVAPPMLAVPVLCLILWTSPAFWLSSAYFSRGSRRAFFLGGCLAGLAPYLAAVILSIAYYAEWIDDGDVPNILEQGDDPWGTFRVAVAVYLPGVCSLIGGTLGMLAWQRREKMAESPPDAGLAREEAGQSPN
jgi:hypothetical protein